MRHIVSPSLGSSSGRGDVGLKSVARSFKDRLGDEALEEVSDIEASSYEFHLS